MYKLTILTPVFIGSGQELDGRDTVLHRNTLIIIDINKIIEKISNNNRALNEFEQGVSDIKKFLDKYRIYYEDVKKYSIPALRFRGRIKEFIKTGLGNPFIPGSSIKGAIRTVFLWHLIKKGNQQEIRNRLEEILEKKPKKQQADDKLDEHIFGKDPNYDFMRAMQISDAEFKISDLKVGEVKILDLKNKNSYGWWTRKGIVDKHYDAFLTFIEALKENYKSKVYIKNDKFLLENNNAKEKLEFNTKSEYFYELASKCNDYAREFIDSEYKFFYECGMNEMIKFYNDLQDQIPKDNNSFILHLGWGGGWKAMTGNWLDINYLKEFKGRFISRFGLGKRVDFPKTRRIVFENNHPSCATGWIKIGK